MSKTTSESDIILNRANVALARSQRLVASWLPPKTSEESGQVKSEEELQREEEEIFQAVPETLGIGAPLPSKAADGSWNRTELSSNDKLRKQLLGKNYNKIMAEKANHKQPAAAPASRTPQNEKKNEESDDDEEEGRTAMVGRKKGKQDSRKRKVEVEVDEQTPSASEGGLETSDVKDGGDDEETPAKAPSRAPKGRKKATSFLDEILADRSKKRKKR